MTQHQHLVGDALDAFIGRDLVVGDDLLKVVLHGCQLSFSQTFNL